YLFKPGDAVRAGGNARIAYWLKKPAQNLALEILDGKGRVVRTIKGAAPQQGRGRGNARPSTSSGRADAETARGEPVEPRARATPAGESEEEGGGRGRGGPATTSMATGLQRFTWDLQAEPVTSFQGMVLWGATQAGPTVLPGTYQA